MVSSSFRYSAVLEACCLLPDLADLPYGDMTEVGPTPHHQQSKVLCMLLLLCTPTLPHHCRDGEVVERSVDMVLGFITNVEILL